MASETHAGFRKNKEGEAVRVLEKLLEKLKLESKGMLPRDRPRTHPAFFQMSDCRPVPKAEVRAGREGPGALQEWSSPEWGILGAVKNCPTQTAPLLPADGLVSFSDNPPSPRSHQQGAHLTSCQLTPQTLGKKERMTVRCHGSRSPPAQSPLVSWTHYPALLLRDSDAGCPQSLSTSPSLPFFPVNLTHPNRHLTPLPHFTLLSSCLSTLSSSLNPLGVMYSHLLYFLPLCTV